MLIEDEVIEKGGSTWTVRPARLDEVRVPTTITGVLQTLLDALPPQERMVLQQAAVIGRVFWDAAVRALDAEAGLDVGLALDGLKRRELVVQRAEAMFGGTRELFFRNALLHEVAYESALLRHRKDWHLRTAAWLIDRAGESRAAGLWYGRAARRAHAACSLDEAAHHYDKAIACWQAHDELAERRRELHEGLAEVLALRDAPPAPS
jgi:predicted ATPase